MNLGMNDNRNMFFSMMNNYNNFMNNNNMNNIDFNMMYLNFINYLNSPNSLYSPLNLILFPNPVTNYNINSTIPYPVNPQKIERKEGLDIKCDVDGLLQSNHELENKNKDIQTIINYIPFTIIQDKLKKLNDEPACIICLSDFEIGGKSFFFTLLSYFPYKMLR